MQVKYYDYLPEEAATIRKAVFMEEQGFENEFDEIDEKAIHIVLFEEGHSVGTCRTFFSASKGCYVIGRIAVNKQFRGQSYGAKIVKAAEEEIEKRGGKKVGLSAQKRAAEFYEKQGYQSVGEVYLDEGCPHIWMSKEL